MLTEINRLLPQIRESKAEIKLLKKRHIMPASGEGVNLAMLDALELSEALINPKFNNLYDAIAAYEMPMQQRGTKEAVAAMQMTEWMHADDARAKMMKPFEFQFIITK
jgi:2-polyprenyl-6-methoxyphenol hydroxylase-like FAD-dependent oxidoreductase